MSLRRLRALATIPLVALAGCGPSAGPGALPSGSGAGSGSLGTDPRPNVILILTDDERSDTLWAMPNVRRLLAAHGVTFTNAFATTTFCCPSRVSILTGQYPHHTGVFDNDPPDGGAPAFRDRSTLATWLHDAGYRTALIGKYLNAYELLGPTYVPPGWDEWDAIASPNAALYYYDYTLNRNGTLVRYGADRSDYITNVLAGIAGGFLRTARPPFFLSFDPTAPHGPSTALPEDLARFQGQRPFRPPSFDEADISDKPWQHPRLSSGEIRGLDAHRIRALAALQPVDRAVASFVEILDRRGQLSNTVIAFMSDNGAVLGEHRLRGKVWPYDESIRVPLVIRSPWIAAPGATDGYIVGNIDLAPTFAELAGVTPALPEDGASLVPFLTGHPPPAWRAGLIVEYLGWLRWAEGPQNFIGIRTQDWAFVEWRDPRGARELYDLRSDPYELQNLAGRSADAQVERDLEALLSRLYRSG